MNAQEDNPKKDTRVEEIVGILDQTIERIAGEARTYGMRVASERRYHTGFGAALAVLSVAAPTLVTYQTQTPGALFQIIAIVLTAIVGAAGSLQATFRWGDRFRRTSLTALALDELESTTRLERLDILHTRDDMTVYRRAFDLNESAQRKLQRIVRRHIEGEVAIVTQEGDKTKPQDPKKKQEEG